MARDGLIIPLCARQKYLWALSGFVGVVPIIFSGVDISLRKQGKNLDKIRE